MTEHLFLTGKKGVGKSTLLRKLLARSGKIPGGFLTLRTENAVPGRISVHLLQLGEVPRPENVLFFCGAPPDAGTAERFDRLGCAALAASRGAELLVMDELGPREKDARRFQASVLQALDGEIPILGVLQQAESDFLRQAASHPSVRIVEVTIANRNTLFP